MTCEESEILLHALLDNELDAGHAREVEAHVAACPRCGVQLSQLRAVHTEMSSPQLRFSAPAGLRARVEATVPAARARVTATPYPMASRWTLLKGFALGSALSGALAASLMIAVIRSDQDQRIMGEVVTAHLRSLQVEHLTDVQTSDQHTVKPWFNGRLDVAPPVVDLTAQGFTLLGGRLDYIDGHAVAAIVYRRRNHVLNLFVAAGAGSEREVKTETVQGFTVKSWSDQGLSFRVVSDINAEELQEFVDRFQAAARQGASLQRGLFFPLQMRCKSGAASLWTAQASGRGNLALSGFMPCNQGGREHRAGAGEARLVAFQPDGQDLANDAFLDIVAQGFDAGIRLDEAVQHDMIAMRFTRPFNAMLAASSAYLDAKGMPTTIADPS